MDDLELLGKACEEYAQYLLFPQLWTDGGSQYVVQREAAIEKILARLDEFAAFAQTVKLESAKSRTLLPALVENAKKLQYVYDLIDALVAFVARMSQNVSLLEERTNQVANSPQFKPAILAAFASLPSPLRSSFQQPTPATSGPKTAADGWQPITVINTTQAFAELRTTLATKKAQDQQGDQPQPQSQP